MAFSITSGYAGVVMEDFLTRASTYNETVAKGLIAVHNNIVKSKKLPRMVMSNIIQAQAVSPSAQGTTTVSERSLTPVDFMAYDLFNPREFEDFWDFSQPDGEVLFRDLPEAARITFIQEIIRLVDEYVGQAIWSGDISGGSAPYNIFDGIVTKALADATVLDVASPIALTSGNIVSKVEATYALLPHAVRKNPNFKIFMSANSGELYRDAIAAQTNKGVDFTGSGPMSYKAKPIFDPVGFPDDTILATIASDDPLRSNIHFGVDWQYGTDNPVIQIEKYRPEDERFFFKFLLKADTQIGFGEELALYSV